MSSIFCFFLGGPSRKAGKAENEAPRPHLSQQRLRLSVEQDWSGQQRRGPRARPREGGPPDPHLCLDHLAALSSSARWFASLVFEFDRTSRSLEVSTFMTPYPRHVPFTYIYKSVASPRVGQRLRVRVKGPVIERGRGRRCTFHLTNWITPRTMGALLSHVCIPSYKFKKNQ